MENGDLHLELFSNVKGNEISIKLWKLMPFNNVEDEAMDTKINEDWRSRR